MVLLLTISASGSGLFRLKERSEGYAAGPPHGRRVQCHTLASVLQAASPAKTRFGGRGRCRELALVRECRAFVSVRAAARQREDRSSGRLAALQGRADLSQTESGGAEGSTRHADSAL